MSIRNKNLTQSCNPKRKSSLTLSFKLHLFTSYFLLLIFYFSAHSVGAEISSEHFDPTDFLASRPDNNKRELNPPQADYTLNDVKSPTTRLGRQLWRAEISAYEGEKDSKSKNELQQLIKQISSVELEPQDKTPEPFIVVEPAQKTKPDKTSSATKVQEKPEKKKDEADSIIPAKPTLSKAEGAETTSTQTLQALDNVLQHPEQLEEPFELAEVLFRSGYLKQAAKCYKEALRRIGKDEVDSPGNKAWILFQTANCLRNDAPAEAMEFYRQIITKYPDSPWVGPAKTRSKLIDWYQQNKPRMLIDENQQRKVANSGL